MYINTPLTSLNLNSGTTITSTVRYNSKDIINELTNLNYVIKELEENVSKEALKVLKEYRSRLINKLKFI